MSWDGLAGYYSFIFMHELWVHMQIIHELGRCDREGRSGVVLFAGHMLNMIYGRYRTPILVVPYC